MQTFKEFLNELGPSTPQVTTGPQNAAPPVPVATARVGASQAQIQQSQSLGSQIEQLNSKIQKLMQDKAIVDKQIAQANAQPGAANAVNQTMAAQAPGTARSALAATMGTPMISSSV